MIRAIFWVTPQPYPQAATSSGRAALDFSGGLLPDLDAAAVDAEHSALARRHLT
jgi:hypothetical protein